MTSTKGLRRALDPIERTIRSSLRRLRVSTTVGSVWQLLGFDLGSDGTESLKAEPFSGIGFYARPRAGSKAEAVLVLIGGTKSPAVVATRDEETRQAIAQLQEDESAVFTSKSIVVIKADGTVEIRSKNGTALPLATKADIDALKTWASSHIHTAPGGGGATTSPTVAPPSAAGTTVLKGE